jgi:site-specific recombinase XerD
MLTRVIRRPDFLARYRATFGSALIDEFTALLLARAYTVMSTKHVLRDAKKFIEWGQSKSIHLGALDDVALDRFDAHNARRARKIRLRLRINAAHFVEFLRDRGIVARADVVATPHPFLPFEQWMLDHRGATPTTVALYVSVLERKVFAPLGAPPARLDARSLRRAVLRSTSRWSVAHAKTIVSATRAFIRFAAAEGQCSIDLVGAIPCVAQWRLATLPRHIAAADVERVIASCDVTTTRGRRDRAVLLLLARLGFRAGDVSTLTLDALDWREARVHVVGKGRRGDWLPLPQDVGDAILAYLQRDRPRHASSRVFLTTRAPIRPIASGRVSTIVTAAVVRSGVEAPMRGSHLLRHSMAVALINSGVGLEKIAAVLRHTSLDATQIYAKVDRGSLSTIAAPWPRTRVCRLPHQHVVDSDLREVAREWPTMPSPEGT